MNFIVDAHLPRRLAWRLREAGYDALHTLDLPNGNRTKDPEINERSVSEKRVLITKDEDFVISFMTHGRPYKLFLVSTGNITNTDLEALIVPRIPRLVQALNTHDYIELTRADIVIHT